MWVIKSNYETTSGRRYFLKIQKAPSPKGKGALKLCSMEIKKIALALIYDQRQRVQKVKLKRLSLK